MILILRTSAAIASFTTTRHSPQRALPRTPITGPQLPDPGHTVSSVGEQFEGISSIHGSRPQRAEQGVGEIEFNDEELGSGVIDAVNRMENFQRELQAQLRKLEDEIQMEREAEEERWHQRALQQRQRELERIPLTR